MLSKLWRSWRRSPSLPLRVTFVAMTYRPGGLYWTVRCLAKQTRPPDEIIFVLDGIDEVEAFGDDGEDSPQLPSMFPAPRIIRLDDHRTYGASIPANKALAAATGDVLILVQDHAQFGESLIETHLEKLGVEGTDRVPDRFAPCLVSGARREHKEWMAAFRDFRGAACTCTPSLFPSVVEIGQEYQNVPQLVSNVSLSTRTADLRAVGGWDEGLDGGYGMDDILLAHRLVAKTGRHCLVSYDRRMMTDRLRCGHDDKTHVRSEEENNALAVAEIRKLKSVIYPPTSGRTIGKR